MRRNYHLYLQDILVSIQDIENFIKNINYDQFTEDRKTHNAVVRKLEVIGEATKNIPKEIRQKYNDIPWGDMAGIRDKIIHSYFNVDYEIVWKTIKNKLPELKPKITLILKEIK